MASYFNDLCFFWFDKFCPILISEMLQTVVARLLVWEEFRESRLGPPVTGYEV